METRYTRYLFIGMLAVIILLSFLIIRPLINVFLWGLILSYLFYPSYKVIKSVVRFPSLASLLTVVLMVLVVTVPLFFIIKGLSEEAFTFYGVAKQELASGSLSISTLTENCVGDHSALCNGARFIDRSMSTFLPQELFKQVGAKFLTGSLNTMIDFVLKLPSMLLNIALSFFITFFLLRDWEKFRQSLYEFAAFKTSDMDKILHRINSTTHSIIFAAVTVAIVQGVLGMVGFYFAGIPSPVLLGAVMGFFALIPLVGTAIIWAPAALYLLGKGVMLDSSMLMYQGIGLLLYGALIISTIDNFLRPKLVGDSAKIHPVVVIAGVIGGTQLMGFVGIFVGPVILSLLITLASMALEKYHHEKQSSLDKHTP